VLACRVGTQTVYFSGTTEDSVVEMGNVADRLARKGFPNWDTIEATDNYIFTSPVRSYQPNAFGLYGTRVRSSNSLIDPMNGSDDSITFWAV